MQKKILINLIMVSACGLLLATVAIYAIQTVMARNMANRTFELQLDNVTERIKQNELQIKELTQAAKEDYISRARALAMMIELDPEIIKDRVKLDEAAASLNVDEIHIIDENGILWWGTQPQYYGMDFATTAQTSQFLEILDNPETEIAQDPMPNGFLGIMRQYAGVSLRNAKGIAQIGMVPERLEEALKNNQICNVLSGSIVGGTGYVFAVTTETGFIASHPNKKLIGAILPESLRESGYILIDEEKALYGTRLVNDYILVAVMPVSELYAQRTYYTLIFSCFMLLVFGAFCGIVSAYIKRRVVNGLSATVNVLEAISEGNLDVNADVRISKEFEKLSDGINHMLLSIKTKMKEIADMADDIRQFGAIVAIADAGIIVKDAEGIVIEWNIGAETILGYKPEEIIGKTTKAYAPPEEHAGIDDIEERLKNGEHIAHVEVVRKGSDGRLVNCSASYTPIFDEQNCYTGSVSIFHDISDKKQIELALHEAVLAAEQANSAKSLFLANMSHEIRTPLNGIIGFAELAADFEGLPDKTKDYLEKIKISGEVLLKIISDILDISKIEAGKVDLEKIPFNIQEVLEACKTISSPKADEKGVSLYFYSELPENGILYGDPTKLRQILLNLISNAIKFTNKGVVKLITVLEESKEKTVSIRFEVIDNGIGMTEEQIKKIFEPFMQADSSTTRKYGGTGLGLTISKDMIELMGGELKVESIKGVGSKFYFTLSFKTAGLPEQAFKSGEVNGNKLKRPFFNGEVLICEDNLINQQVIQEHLAKVGLKAIIAENGKEGIEALKKREGNPFDLIIMDIHMPVMDGLEASKKLRSMGIKTPVIALTANAMSKDKDTFLQNGMNGYLTKPFKAQELWDILLKFLTPVENSEKNQEVLDKHSGVEQSGGDEGLYYKLLARFLKYNKNAYKDIYGAINDGDIKTAYRLTHTLKGVAGTLGAKPLQNAVEEVEKLLVENMFEVDCEQMLRLKERLDEVLSEIKFLLKNKPEGQESGLPAYANGLPVTQAINFIEKLLPMLESCNMQSIDLLPEIKEALSPLGEISFRLLEQIENCDFTQSLKTLKQIKTMLESKAR